LGADALSWFDCIAAGDIVANKKPALDIYEYALAQLGLKPEECLAFEDSENGLKSALAACVPSIITVNEYTKMQDFGGSLLVVDQLGEPDEPSKAVQGNLGQTEYITAKFLKTLFA